MAFEETMKSVSHALSGAAAVAAAPLFLPGVSRVTRPVLKTAIRGYWAATQTLGTPVEWVSDAQRRTGEAVERAREQLADVIEEARAERESERRAEAKAAHAAEGEEEVAHGKKRGHGHGKGGRAHDDD